MRHCAFVSSRKSELKAILFFLTTEGICQRIVFQNIHRIITDAKRKQLHLYWEEIQLFFENFSELERIEKLRIVIKEKSLSDTDGESMEMHFCTKSIWKICPRIDFFLKYPKE